MCKFLALIIIVTQTKQNEKTKIKPEELKTAANEWNEQIIMAERITSEELAPENKRKRKESHNKKRLKTRIGF